MNTHILESNLALPSKGGVARIIWYSKTTSRYSPWSKSQQIIIWAKSGSMSVLVWPRSLKYFWTFINGWGKKIKRIIMTHGNDVKFTSTSVSTVSLAHAHACWFMYCGVQKLWQRPSGLQSWKYLFSGTLQEKICRPWPYRNSCRYVQGGCARAFAGMLFVMEGNWDWSECPSGSDYITKS